MLASFFAFVLNQISPYFSKIVYIAYMLNVLFIIIEQVQFRFNSG